MTGDESVDGTPEGDECFEATLTVSDCERCPALVDSRSTIVSGVGPREADLLFVGEAPGEREDQQGEPFVGRSGQVLDDGLRDVGLHRSDVRITNCVRCRPPDNRDPTADELANCRGYLDHEIATLAPKLVVTLGKVPAELLLDRDVAVTTEAGNIDELSIGDHTQRVLICVHPAATLYDPGQRDTFAKTLDKAVEYVGTGGQSTLGEF